jgi:hypothetical protein
MWPSQLGELGHPAGRRRFRGDLQPAEPTGKYVITRCITYLLRRGSQLAAGTLRTMYGGRPSSVVELTVR